LLFFSPMKTKTLFFCPVDEDELLFEEVYDERLDFVYQPLHEIPQVCPKCGRLLYKKDCLQIEELFSSDPQSRSIGA
jgi:transcription initiation factor IIE alpha subunit